MYRDGARRRSSEFKSAVEFRLGEKSAGDLQDFIGPAQFLDLPFQRLDGSRSSVLTPSRTPLSTSSRLIHSNSVCGVRSIVGAIDSVAAHSDGCSLRFSRTRRPARSRTSGKNLFGFLFMAPFVQILVPPQPGVVSQERRWLARFDQCTLWQKYGHIRGSGDSQSIKHTGGEPNASVHTQWSAVP